MIVAYVHTHKDRFGVEPICAVLSEHGIPIAPSTYYARVRCPVTAAELEEAYLVNALVTLHQDNWGVYGAPEVVARSPTGRVRHRPRPGCPADEDRRDQRHGPR